MNPQLVLTQLKYLNADVIETDKLSKAMTLKFDDKYIIAIPFDSQDKEWIIAHEIEHITNGTFYSNDSNLYNILKMEQITDESLIYKSMLEQGETPQFLEKRIKIMNLKKLAKEVKNDACIQVSRW